MADSDRTDGPTANQSSERNSPPRPSSVASTPAEKERFHVSFGKKTAPPTTTATDGPNHKTAEDVPRTASENDTPMTEPEVAGDVMERDFDQKEPSMPSKEDEEKSGEPVKHNAEARNVTVLKSDACDLTEASEKKMKESQESVARPVGNTAQNADDSAAGSKDLIENDISSAPRDKKHTANSILRAFNVSAQSSSPQRSRIIAGETEASQAKSDAQRTPAMATKKNSSPLRSPSRSRESDDSKHDTTEPRSRSVSDRFDLRATLQYAPRESSSPLPKSSQSREEAAKIVGTGLNADDSMDLIEPESPRRSPKEDRHGREQERSSDMYVSPKRGMDIEEDMKPESTGSTGRQGEDNMAEPCGDSVENSGERERIVEGLMDAPVDQERMQLQTRDESAGGVKSFERSPTGQAKTIRTQNSGEPLSSRKHGGSSMELDAQEPVEVYPTPRKGLKDEDRMEDQLLQVTKDSSAASPEPMDLDSSHADVTPAKEVNQPDTDGVVNEKARETHFNNRTSPAIQNTNSSEQNLTEMANGLQAKVEPEDAMEFSLARLKDKRDNEMEISPALVKRIDSEIPSNRKDSGAGQAEDIQRGRKESAALPDGSGSASNNHPSDSSKRKLDSSSPQRRKRERSPIADRRNVNQGGLPRESMVNRAFSGRVELSAYCGHRIVAHVGGQELRGWVLDADVSSLENRSTPEEPAKKEASKGGEGEGLSLPPDIRVKPRKVPVARRTKKVVPLAKDHAMAIDDLGCAPGIITGSDVPKRSAIVIGAGIAGIAAARALNDRGFVVTVLEARGRLGGRIATDWSMGSPVDLGAAFIHGCYGNPLSEIAREADIRTFSPRDVGSLIHANGQRVSSSDDRHAESIWRALLRRSGTIARGSLMKHSSLDIALGKLLNRLKEEVVDGCSEEVTQLLAWHAANLEAACASDMSNLSAKHYDMDDRSGFSGSHKLVRDGYSSIVHALTGDLDVHYNSEVIAVQRDVPIHLPATEKTSAQKGKRSFGSKQYQEALLRDVHTESQKSRSVRYLDGVKRQTKSDSGVSAEQECTSQRLGVRVMVENGKEYVAESCIVTVPLGVLQKGDISFIPPLPPWKHDVIHNIGFGLVNKVVLRFDTPFWVDDVTNAGDDDRPDCDGPDHIGRVSGEHGVFYMFLSLLRCIGAPVLVAITSGRFAEHLEGLSDEEVVGMALKALRHMFPTRTIGTLLSHSVTRWKTDKYARGSYSFAKVGTTPQDYSRMSEPIGSLCFAGEATHRNHPATAHGAFMSGIREAARLIERSDLSGQERRKHARELFLMQEPHATFEKAVTCNGGAEMSNGHVKSEGSRRHSTANGNSRGMANGSASRKKKQSQGSRG